MRKHDDVSRITTAWRSLKALGRRRPTVLRAGALFSLMTLVAACTDITRPADQLQKPETPRLNVSQGDGPKIGTDKQDYYPGETVVIEGWDWTPGETVRLQVVHVGEGDNALAEHQVWEVTADANGYITSSWAIAVEGDEIGATLKLTADGVTSLAHAEVIFTDLDGTVNLFVDAGRATAQSAFQWNETVYPRIRTPKKSTCYRLRWTDPSSDVTTTFVETGDPAGTNADPAGLPVGQESGTWSLIVDQRASSNCTDQTGYASATNPIYFDVARRVIIGAGTSASTTDAAAEGGDQCVYQTNNISSSGTPVCQNPGGATNITMFVRKQLNDEIRSYVRFDLTDAIPAIPAGAIVTDAKVRLSVAGTASRTYRIQPADASWAEGTITFATQPGVTGTFSDVAMASALVAGAGGGDPQTWVKFPVTANVQGFLDTPATNYGWRISDVSATNSSTAGRFHTTENTGGCAAGVTTCKRTWPVLLIDYTEPPKLEFYTTAKTGIVGQCLGPIQVQSKDFAGAVLPVTGNLTVNLSVTNLGVGDGAGAPGAGSFFSNGTCTTGTTTTTIVNGASISAAFYYRATERGDGGHDVVASATGYTPNPSQTETINKAPTTLTYTGDRLVFVGNTFNFTGTIDSPFEPCTENKRVLFRILPSPLDQSVPFLERVDYSDTDGLAAASAPTAGWIEDIYDGRMSLNQTDDNCLVSKDDFTVAVLTPGGAATGGGFLAGNKVGGGRANFGFNIRPIEGSDPLAYKGQFLLIRQDGGVPTFRCKGAIDTYGTVSGSDPLLNVASGRCDFQIWNPSLNSGEGGWEVPDGPGYANRQFIIQFIDNGTGKGGKNAPPPDEFGFSIDFVGSIADPSFGIAPINGGNIDVKDGGVTTTGGGTKGGGKKG